MTWLFTSDLHLSDRPKDRYRFGLFPWLAEQQQKHQATATFILGDITDRKDNHSAVLVNKTVNSLLMLKPPVYILKGNHDFIDPANPFFEFLNCVDGIEFVSEPTLLKSLNVAMIPHQPDQASFDAACKIIPPKATVLIHQMMDGAIAETGAHLTGLGASAIEAKRPARVYAGDIHKPQQCGPVAYVGAPYTVRFGDDFIPRVLLLKNDVEQNLYFPCLHKWVLRVRDADEILNNVNLRPKDQVKIVIALAREEVVEWGKYKQKVLAACKELELEVFGVDLEVSTQQSERVKLQAGKLRSNREILTEFCKSEKLANNIRNTGLELLNE